MFFLWFENHFFSGIMKYNFSIFAPFLLEAVEDSLSYFFKKLVLTIKMSTSQDLKTTFKYNLTSFSQSQIKKHTSMWDTLYAKCSWGVKCSGKQSVPQPRDPFQSCLMHCTLLLHYSIYFSTTTGSFLRPFKQFLVSM